MSSGSAFAFASTTDSTGGHLVGDGLAPQAPHKPLRTVLAHVLLEHGRGPLQPTGTGPLELTPDHLRAAQTCGCVFLPATDAQVQRLSMQRRIFRIGGKPFVATRDGGAFLETHATLLPLIGGQAPGRERGSEETAQEAAAADAEAAAEIATEQGAARGGAQVVRRGAAKGGSARWR